MQLYRLLNVILEAAVAMLGFDAATITVRHSGSLTTIAATNQPWIALDEAQYYAGDGPCLTVLEPHEPILIEDVAALERWHEFKATAKHFGVSTSLSVHLPTDDLEGVTASLNLYACDAVKPRIVGVDSATDFARQLGVAMQAAEAHRATADLADGLAEAMRSRAVIEQAKGILIAQHGGSADDAFNRLRQLSQHSNIKVRDVAKRLVDEHSVRANGHPPAELTVSNA